MKMMNLSVSRDWDTSDSSGRQQLEAIKMSEIKALLKPLDSVQMWTIPTQFLRSRQRTCEFPPLCLLLTNWENFKYNRSGYFELFHSSPEENEKTAALQCTSPLGMDALPHLHWIFPEQCLLSTFPDPASGTCLWFISRICNLMKSLLFKYGDIIKTSEFCICTFESGTEGVSSSSCK